ncbi:MAG: hypothetical protein ACK5PB_00745 [Pirellula sp.]|jgi:hypothetical protein
MITSPIHDENAHPASESETAETQRPPVDSATETATLEANELDAHALEVTAPYVGKWNTLISQTNWEKGRIIAEWRSALIEANATVTDYSDETWSKQVGAVTSQHVGRLRRVYERFGASQQSYQGLYWSHFLAALDWDDAELWLEGAVRSGWSISEMRRTRWEAAGGDPKHNPKDVELITSEVDDGFTSLKSQDEEDIESDRSADDSISTGKSYEDADFGDADEDNLNSSGSSPEAMQSESDSAWDDDSKQMANPFASLPSLPPDVADALEQFKLCIVRHRSTQWADVSQKSMLDALDALRTFATY